MPALSTKVMRVIGYDIEDLLQFSPRFVETALKSERSRMGVEQLRIARVESLRFVKITFALLPISSLSHELRQQPLNLSVVWEKRTRPLEVMFRRVVIIQTIVMIFSHGQKRFAKARLER